MKDHIMSRTLTELKNELEKSDFPRFRAEQLYNWFYKNTTAKLENMTNIPQDFKSFLKKEYVFTALTRRDINEVKDGTLKFLWQTKEDNHLESVLIPQNNKDNYTACLSSQIGCNLGCKFCASGVSGKIRDLTAGEIVEQLWQMKKYLAEYKTGDIRNIVFMGMGEPLLNYEALKNSLKIFITDKGFDFGKRRITVSTVGIVPKIKRFADDFSQIGLAISLHSADSKIRSQLIPINRKYSLEQLKKSLHYYNNTTGRRVTLEYIVFAGKNNSREDAKKLQEFCSGLNSHINLLRANPVEELEVKSTPQKKVNEFKKLLKDLGLSVSIRESRGKDKEAACGQLRLQREE